ncbi:hypothetical protein ACFE04_007324 [Oxalis oulophora]
MPRHKGGREGVYAENGWHVSDAIDRRLHEKDIDNFDTFYATILEIFSTFNSALPGKHYDAPSRQEIRGLDGNFGFVIYDSVARNLFAAFGKNEGEKLMYWGLTADGSMVISDNLDIIKGSCAKSFAPFPNVSGKQGTKNCGNKSNNHEDQPYESNARAGRMAESKDIKSCI